MSFDSFDLTTISIIASDDTSTKGMTLEELRGLTKFHFRFMQGLVLVLSLVVFFAEPKQAMIIEEIFLVAIVVVVMVFFHYTLKHEVCRLDEAIKRRDRDKEKKS